VSDPVSTGCSPVDDLLGGGFDRGGVTQIYGPPAAGKTNLVLSAAAETTARGHAALYIDTEGLSVDRMEQVVTARAAATDEDLEALASRLIVTDVHTFSEQEEAVQDSPRRWS
jgi:DNA repair protein RadB